MCRNPSQCLETYANPSTHQVPTNCNRRHHFVHCWRLSDSPGADHDPASGVSLGLDRSPLASRHCTNAPSLLVICVSLNDLCNAGDRSDVHDIYLVLVLSPAIAVPGTGWGRELDLREFGDVVRAFNLGNSNEEGRNPSKDDRKS